VIKAFAKESLELLAFRKLNRDNEHANVEYTRISTLLTITITLFVESVVCVILGYGGFLVHTGVFGAGEMVEFIGYFTTIVWPIEAVAMLIEMSAKGQASLKRISALLETEVAVKDREDVVPLETVRGDITFKHLNFSYPGTTRPVLKDVSFEIHAGENVGIIGRTGAGKTTIADILVRTENVPEGTVFVDGRDVNSIPIKALREHIAYVPQDNFLFSDTIANNIAFAFQDSEDLEAIQTAARYADVHDNIIAFPNQYQTLLGERGVTVSGGQKQRISIARALMKEAEILILDDSVSAVDTKTERAILEHLRQTRAGKTTLLIAHRISTIQHMDRIIFLEDGRVAAVGSHEELLKTCPAYEELVNRQLLEDEERKEGM
jgi:ATP-binding cassette subfamily B protein